MKAFIHRSALPGVLLALGLLVGCGGGSSTQQEQPSATITSITVGPSAVSLPAGKTQQFTATANLADGSTRDVTNTVVWSSSNTAVLTVSTTGLATAVGAGSASVSATFSSAASGLTGSTGVTVTPAALISIAISSTTVTTNFGQAVQFKAIGTFTNGTLDITSQVTWISSNPAVVQITSGGPNAGLAIAVGVGSATISCTMVSPSSARLAVSGATITSSSTISLAVAAPVSLAITTPATTTVFGAPPLAFKATATYSDNSTLDVTSVVAWTSSAPTVATIATNGLATTTGVGTVVFSASVPGAPTITASSPTVTVTAAPTTSAVTAASVTFPSNATVSVTVSASGAVPTGSVSLSVDGGAPLTATLSNGVGSFTLTSPAAGDHSLAVTYAAQGNFLGSTATGSLHVNASATTSALTAPAIVFNANGVVTVTVSSTGGTPTGNVSLTVDGGAPLTSALSSGVATFTLTSPNAGTHTLSANYAQQGSFGPSSASGTLTVAPGPTSTAINAPTVTYNTDGSITVTVTSATGTPTGNVSLTVDAGAPQTAALTNGSATFTLTAPNAGAHTLAASYAAQGNFDTSSATGTLTVNQAPTTLAVNAPTVTYNADGVVTVSLTSAAGTPTGSVSLIVDGGAPLIGTLASGSAAFTLSAPNAGAHTLSATFAAQGNFAASSGTGTLTVNPAATTSAITSPTVTFNANGIVTVNVTSSGGTPTGNVSLTVDAGAPLTAALVSGSVVFTLPSPNAGAHNLSASYAAQGNFAASSATGTLTVNLAPTTTTVTAPPVVFNASGIITVNVTSPGGLPGGSATVTVDAGAPQSVSLANGVGILILTAPNAGTHSISVTYPVTGNFDTSSATGSLVVSPAPTTTSISAPSVPLNPTGSATVTVTVSSVAGTPTGNASLVVDGGAPLSQPLVSGAATFNLTGLTATSHTLAASYPLTGNFDASSATGTLTIAPAALVSIAVTPGTVPVLPNGTTQAFTATGTYSDNTTQNLTSSVTWNSSNSAVASISVNGVATALTAGTTNITASSGAIVSPAVAMPVKQLTSIAVTPASSAVALASPPIQYTAVGTYSDTTTADITTNSNVTWGSSDLTVATITAGGLASTAGAGSTTISATFTFAPVTVTGTASLNVTAFVPRYAFVANDGDNTLSGYSVDPTTGQLRANGYQYVTLAPGVVTTHPSQPFLFVGFPPHPGGLALLPGFISAYNFGTNGVPQLVNSAPLPNTAGAAAFTTDASGSYLLEVGGNSDLNVYPINPSTGALGAPVSVFTWGTNPAGVAIDPTGRFVYTADSGDADISLFTFSAGTPVPNNPDNIAAGTQPTGIVIEPSGKYLYATDVVGLSVLEYSIDQNTGVLTQIGTTPIAAANLNSIAVDPAGRFVFVPTTSPSGVAMFSINTNGTLASLGSVITGVGPASIAMDPSGQFAYVTDNSTGRVIVFQVTGSGLTPLGTSRARMQPNSLAVSSGLTAVAYQSTFAYVANNASSDVAQFDALGLSSLGPNALTDLQPISIAANPLATFAYTANSQGSVSEFTIGSGGLLGPIIGSTVTSGLFTSPSSVVIDPSGAFAYVANSGSLKLSEFVIGNGGSLTSFGPFDTTAANVIPVTLAMDPMGQFVFSANGGTNNVSAFSLDPVTGNLTFVNTVAAGTSTVGIAVHPNGLFVYAVNTTSKDVSVFSVGSGGTLTSAGSAGAGNKPVAIALDPTGKFAYVANQLDNTVSIYLVDSSTGALTPSGTMPTGVTPSAVSVDPAGTRLWVANAGDGTVSVFDIDPFSGQLTATFGSPLSTGGSHNLPKAIVIVGGPQ